jgi:choline dehydrogenase
MSQSAGGVHDCSHGALTARLLGPVCAFNAPALPERYARVAVGMGVDVSGLGALDAALAGVDAVLGLTERVGIPSLADLGFAEDEIPMLARIAYEDPQTIGNPRELGVAEYEEIYRSAFLAGGQGAGSAGATLG